MTKKLKSDVTEEYYDVFLSYSSKNQDKADKIYKAIQKAGGFVFQSGKNLEAGTDFSDSIKKAIRASREFWLLASPESTKSEWVISEWAAAWALDKKIVPILFQCSPKDLPDRLEAKQAINIDEYQDYIKRCFPKIPGAGFAWNNVLRIVDKLLAMNDVHCAITVGRIYLMEKEYDKGIKVFEYILEEIGDKHEMSPVALGNIAYCLIGKRKRNAYEKARDLLLNLKRKNHGKSFEVWHSIALAFTYNKLEESTKFKEWLKKSREYPNYKDLVEWFIQLYPEIKNEILNNGN